MILVMQADELFPGGEDIVRGSADRAAQTGRCRDYLLDAIRTSAQPRRASSAITSAASSRRPGQNIDNRRLYLRGIEMAQLHSGELLKMIVKKPRMVDDCLKNERFAAGDGGAMAAVDRGSMLAADLLPYRGRRRAPAMQTDLRPASAEFDSLPSRQRMHSGTRAERAGPRAHPHWFGNLEHTPQAIPKFAAVISTYRLIANRGDGLT